MFELIRETPMAEYDGRSRYYVHKATGMEVFHIQTKTEVMEALGHDWGEWVVVKEPTEEEPGREERTCNRCGKKETGNGTPLYSFYQLSPSSA